MNALSRRHFIRQAGAVAVVAGVPRLAFANADTDARFVLMILRGGLDGLAAVPAYGDPNYRSRRGELVLEHAGSAKSILPLDNTFGLHPALQGLQARYAANEVVVVHAVATPYRERSHFDGQDVLENGTSSALATRDGWLNRALATMPDVLQSTTTGGAAIALAPTTPLVLQGDVRVSSWAPSRLPVLDC